MTEQQQPSQEQIQQIQEYLSKSGELLDDINNGTNVAIEKTQGMIQMGAPDNVVAVLNDFVSKITDINNSVSPAENVLEQLVQIFEQTVPPQPDAEEPEVVEEGPADE